jgi:hypothetical protein
VQHGVAANERQADDARLLLRIQVGHVQFTVNVMYWTAMLLRTQVGHAMHFNVMLCNGLQ